MRSNSLVNNCYMETRRVQWQKLEKLGGKNQDSAVEETKRAQWKNLKELSGRN